MTAAPNKLGHAERRARFRELQRFNPTAPAWEAIKAGLVLDDIHGALHSKLAIRAELEPGSQQLLAGRIGSGKTTELLLTHQLLTQQPNTFPVFIDISEETDVSDLKPGALIAAFGLRVATALHAPDDLKNAARQLQNFAVGHWEFADSGDDRSNEYSNLTYFPRKLFPPVLEFRRWFSEIEQPLRKLLAFVCPSGDTIVLFDGLDRIVAAERFWLMTESDFRAFRALGISVITTAPLTVLFGSGKAVSDQFDRVHYLSAITYENSRPEACLETTGRVEHNWRERG